jgi:hypothetical protein
MLALYEYIEYNFILFIFTTLEAKQHIKTQHKVHCVIIPKMGLRPIPLFPKRNKIFYVILIARIPQQGYY